MAEFPALPLWTDAYFADTRHLTTLESGAYLHLLMVAWRTPLCALPDDDRLLARYAGLEMRAWKAVRQSVMAFWDKGEDGLLRQKRLSKERAYVTDLNSKRAEAGRLGGLHSAASRSLRNNDPTQATLKQTSSKIQAPTPIPTPIEETNVSSPPIIPPAKSEPKNGSRIDADWEPTASDYDIALREGFTDAQTRRLIEAFRDYWSSVPGAKGRKLSWGGTWRNYVRSDIARRQAGGAVVPFSGSSQSRASILEAARSALAHRNPNI